MINIIYICIKIINKYIFRYVCLAMKYIKNEVYQTKSNRRHPAVNVLFNFHFAC